MSEKFEFNEMMRYFASMSHIQEMKLGKYTVLYLLKAVSKIRTEYFVFDSKDIEGLSDEEIGNIVKSSPLLKTGFEIDGYKEGRYRYVRFNTRIQLHQRLDLFTKTFLNNTKDVKIQREFRIGKTGENSNPKFYKYVWWVFHKGVSCENIEELVDSSEYRFTSTKDLDDFIHELKQNNKPLAIVRKGYTRLGVKAFDYTKMKKENPDIEFAPALEDDKENTKGETR